MIQPGTRCGNVLCTHARMRRSTNAQTLSLSLTLSWTVFANDEGTGANDASCTVRLTQAFATSLMVAATSDQRPGPSLTYRARADEAW